MRVAIFFMFNLICFVSIAQGGGGESDAITSGQQWDEFNFTHLHHKIVFQGDVQASFSNDSLSKINLSKHLIQLGVRGWVHYYITPRIKLSAYLGYWNNLKVAEIKQAQFSEIRPAVQFQYFFVRGSSTIYNRLRLEDRYIENPITDVYENTYRLRYMPKLIMALNSKSIRTKTTYLILSDEIFMNINKGQAIDQNRFNLGLGYCFTDDIAIEVVYTHQTKVVTESNKEITNAIGITFSMNNIGNILKVK